MLVYPYARFPNNPDLMVWSGPLPHKELGAALLVRGVGLTAAGKLTSKSLELVSSLTLPHAVTLTVEDEVSPATPETYLNLDGNYFFDVTTATACFCKSCSNDYASGQSHVKDLYSVDLATSKPTACLSKSCSSTATPVVRPL